MHPERVRLPAPSRYGPRCSSSFTMTIAPCYCIIRIKICAGSQIYVTRSSESDLQNMMTFEGTWFGVIGICRGRHPVFVACVGPIVARKAAQTMHDFQFMNHLHMRMAADD